MKSRETIKQNASALLGKPYVWGGENDTEGGYDCSGFVHAVLNKSGIRIGRTTAQGYYNYFQTKMHTKTPLCGDLLFFGKSLTNITHVAIAKDNLNMWESIGSSKNTREKPGKGVVISPISRRKDLLCIIDIIDEGSIYYPRYTGKSNKIDIVFQEIGAPYGSVAKRRTIAIRNNILNYKGTLTQNLILIKLAKAGTLLKI